MTEKMYEKLTHDEKQTLDIDFGNNSDKFRRQYLDMSEGVQPVVSNTTRFDESSDLTMTYLGGIDVTRISKVKAEETICISDQGYTEGKLLDGTECEILIDTGASLSYMSKVYYLRCKS